MFVNVWLRKILWIDYKLLVCKFRSIFSRWKDKFYVFFIESKYKFNSFCYNEIDVKI